MAANLTRQAVQLAVTKIQPSRWVYMFKKTAVFAADCYRPFDIAVPLPKYHCRVKDVFKHSFWAPSVWRYGVSASVPLKDSVVMKMTIHLLNCSNWLKWARNATGSGVKFCVQTLLKSLGWKVNRGPSCVYAWIWWKKMKVKLMVIRTLKILLPVDHARVRWIMETPK